MPPRPIALSIILNACCGLGMAANRAILLTNSLCRLFTHGAPRQLGIALVNLVESLFRGADTLLLSPLFVGFTDSQDLIDKHALALFGGFPPGRFPGRFLCDDPGVPREWLP